MIQGYHEFEFNLPKALLSQVVEKFAEVGSTELSPKNLEVIPDAQGVYQLFYQDRLVYIGKTDAEAGLRARLGRHLRNVQHRVGIEPNSVKFTALRVLVFSAMDLETQLIVHYEQPQQLNLWNRSGFGSNDPGRERESSKASEFDLEYPLDLSQPLSMELSDCSTVGEALKLMKKRVPYVFRYQTKGGKSRQAHADLANCPLPTCPETLTMEKFLTTIVNALPLGWQATGLPGRVILYRENCNYANSIIFRK